MIDRKSEIYVVGSGGHAKVVRDVVTRMGLGVAAFAVEAPPDESAHGLPLISLSELMRVMQRQQAIAVIVAVGDNTKRQRLTLLIKEGVPSCHFSTAIDPSAVVSGSTTIGAGSSIGPGAIVNAGAQIGEHCIVNSGAIIEHDSTVSDYASVAPGAILAGRASVGKAAYVGAGAIVREGISIGDHAVLGAGGAAVAPIEARCVALGVPARVVRRREPGDKIYD